MSQGHSQNIQDVIQGQSVNPDVGLSNEEAALRLKKYGKNSLLQEEHVQFLDIFKEEVTEPMILLLIAIGVLYSILGGLTDALTIISIIIVLVLAEVYNEYRTKRSISALRQLAPPTALVMRGGEPKEVQTSDLVPGDILLLKVGQRVPADARLVEAYGLQVDESSLTGESYPVSKDSQIVLSAQTRIAEQSNMVFTGTIITRGRAKALVISTGLNSELGKISKTTKTVKPSKTELQLAMKQLSKTLVWVALFFSILIPVLSFARGLQPNPAEAVLYGLSLAFVVIPEELPIIITMVLGIGGYALAKRGAIAKRLRAAETLGSVTIIATDKTGTLTEGKMQVGHLCFDGEMTWTRDFGPNQKSVLRTALLASDAIKSAGDNLVLSNPMSSAIFDRLMMDENNPPMDNNWVLKGEASFDDKRKLASYIYQYGKSSIVMTSGAPEALMAKSSKILLGGEEKPLTPEDKQVAYNIMAKMAQAGERLIAFGYHRLSADSDFEPEQLERDIVFVGAVGFIDPPRKEVKDAIANCQKAGINVVMITGDHPFTAKAIATQVGINSTHVLAGVELSKMNDSDLKVALQNTFVFARVTPEEKLRLVRLIKENGEVVAVTGDGINDAPALKEAHIGIAMGIKGTDVAKESADMILTDDNFTTIETAVHEGRKLFGNLRKGVRYYLACKLALVTIFLLPILLGAPLPFSPIQIIVLELFMDLAASATFVAEPAETGIMNKPPNNPKEKFMNKKMIISIAVGALSLFAAVSVAYLIAWYQNPVPANIVHAQTVAFATWMLGHILLALNLRSEREPLVKLGFLSNRVMVAWALVVIVVLLLGTNLAFIAGPLKLVSLGAVDWVVVVLAAVLGTFWLELKKLFWKR
ncbi:MAG: cation-transporting P-type ATPase [Candidatus Bathyarchaeota archaeon]|nr:cation-transporting P-type ATPase [Candidatus Bathyarchaeota archaeon]